MKTEKLHLLIALLVFFKVLLLNTALYGQLPDDNTPSTEQPVEQQQQLADRQNHPGEKKVKLEDQSEDTAQSVEQQQEHQEEKKFKLEGHLLEQIKRKISQEQFEVLLKEVNNRKLSQAELSELLLQLDVKDKVRAGLLQEADEYLKLINTVKTIIPIALEINLTETEIQATKEQLETAQSDEVKGELTYKIEKLTAESEEDRNRIKDLSREINEGQDEQLYNILSQLGYEIEESKTIVLQIMTQVDLIKKISTVDSMIESIEYNIKRLEELEELKKKTSSDEEKSHLTKEAKMLGERIEELYNNFTILVTGIDRHQLFQKDEKKTDWNKELQDVFSPLIVQLKQVTERPRQMEILRSQIGYYEARLPQIQDALQGITTLNKNINKKNIVEQLLRLEERWEQYEKEYMGKLEAARSQLFELEKDKMSFLQVTEYLLESVFKQRGTNMLYAVAAFLITFFIFYLLRLVIRKLNPLNYSQRFMFLGNLIDVFLYAVSLLMATAAMIIVLYIYGNWLVLGLIAIVLLGLVWAARSTVPKFVEQIKLLMGFGSVRQGERIAVDGIPYEVISIGIYSYFENPLLQSATLRFPLKDLVNMRSHPCDRSEPWFPCEEGDHVLMEGPQPVWRKVVLQTPSVIKLEWFGMVETVQTVAFLKQNILNLSEGPFWVRFEFELGYNHRREVEDICQKLVEITSAEMQKTPFAEFMLAPWIDFDNFGNSSLIFRYWVQMQKEAAKSYPAIQRALKKIALKAANTYDLEIIPLEHKCDHQVTESDRTTANLPKALPDSGQEV